LSDLAGIAAEFIETRIQQVQAAYAEL